MIESFLNGGIGDLFALLAVLFAAKAERNSRPVANGFTKYVLEKLEGIETKIDNHQH